MVTTINREKKNCRQKFRLESSAWHFHLIDIILFMKKQTKKCEIEGPFLPLCSDL